MTENELFEYSQIFTNGWRELTKKSKDIERASQIEKNMKLLF